MLELINSFSFIKFGEFKINPTTNKIIYQSSVDSFDCMIVPKVYLWINKLEDRSEILYVGKTKYSIKKRMAQHRQGFKGKIGNGSKSGFLKYTHIYDCLKNNKFIEVWARKSELKPIVINKVDYEQLSQYSLEEEFFIKYLRDKNHVLIFNY